METKSELRFTSWTGQEVCYTTEYKSLKVSTVKEKRSSFSTET